MTALIVVDALLGIFVVFLGFALLDARRDRDFARDQYEMALRMLEVYESSKVTLPLPDPRLNHMEFKLPLPDPRHMRRTP